jgi:hypothetical protein
MPYVMCRVSGGVTGTRTALLKQNGTVRQFESMAEAEAEAKRLSDAANADRYRTAYFQYWAVEG